MSSFRQRILFVHTFSVNSLPELIATLAVSKIACSYDINHPTADVLLLHLTEVHIVNEAALTTLSANCIVLICMLNAANTNLSLFREAIYLDPSSPNIPNQIITFYHLLRSRMRLEDEARRKHLETLQTMVTHNLAHEFRTPIMHIKSGLTFIQQARNEHNIEPGMFDIVEEATMRLERLIDNLTMLGSTLEISPGALILRDAIRYSISTLTRAWRVRHEVHRVQTRLPDRLPPLYADKNAILTVFHLLLENALRFSDGLVLISAREVNEGVEIAISDSGIGIETDQLDIIFEQFVQADSSTTRRHAGLGLGLSVVKKILEHHHSTVSIASEPGIGTTVRFTLPTASKKAYP